MRCDLATISKLLSWVSVWQIPRVRLREATVYRPSTSVLAHEFANVLTGKVSVDMDRPASRIMYPPKV